ncbi:hypothetical protein ABB37_05837 [Leptomonas pyrrhocoris]|uniref:Uncharacterized protein n=1 Tax=Leptomonas pyrrhocoris TaxID=157538 RepID=A0A0M9FYQ4_LEPPY|nr:hypothetical protein ABB37_05837 [Leptomonas pyrrhocoris]XP_015657143.1 hypothetical protein ABB37_05837 [Leptomonas pyrrhocoris]KPA78703.1 hypothetical protein ABB37_05837 [Leptomonas pyrrhocoris]KPA78704.1 hypothetical protein ABB37_05837 [Leptomonas pyrrhocoris]|eukprot:XP_015657142.1 hypothetical protein ABB37_05837 [Leptomonas pyrrhocoris]
MTIVPLSPQEGTMQCHNDQVRQECVTSSRRRLLDGSIEKLPTPLSPPYAAIPPLNQGVRGIVRRSRSAGGASSTMTGRRLGAPTPPPPPIFWRGTATPRRSASLRVNNSRLATGRRPTASFAGWAAGSGIAPPHPHAAPDGGGGSGLGQRYGRGDSGAWTSGDGTAVKEGLLKSRSPVALQRASCLRATPVDCLRTGGAVLEGGSVAACGASSAEPRRIPRRYTHATALLRRGALPSL